MNGDDEPTAPRVPLQSAVLNHLAAQRRAAGGEDPNEAEAKEEEKKANEAEAKSRFGRNTGLVLLPGGKRYWVVKGSNDAYEAIGSTFKIGRYLGKFVKGPPPRIEAAGGKEDDDPK